MKKKFDLLNFLLKKEDVDTTFVTFIIFLHLIKTLFVNRVLIEKAAKKFSLIRIYVLKIKIGWAGNILQSTCLACEKLLALPPVTQKQTSRKVV